MTARVRAASARSTRASIESPLLGPMRISRRASSSVRRTSSTTMCRGIPGAFIRSTTSCTAGSSRSFGFRSRLDGTEGARQLSSGFTTGYTGRFGAWLSLVERLVRDQEAGGSNPLAPTNLTRCNYTQLILFRTTCSYVGASAVRNLVSILRFLHRPARLSPPLTRNRLYGLQLCLNFSTSGLN